MDNNEILIDNGYSNGRIDKLTLNGTINESVMYVNSSCTGIFVDKINNRYCSSTNEHRIFKVELKINMTKRMIVAGTGCSGPVSNMLDHPRGIFVDQHLNLFVADTDNNRIQRFEFNQINVVTVAGFGSSVYFILNKPTSVILDGNYFLFIVDNQNHRIIRSMSNGFQCLFGCSNDHGTLTNQLNNSQTMAFDKDGHIFVTDFNNHRIEKFILIQNSCSMYYLYLSYHRKI